uniref:Uncharacterized protein n=1 Tax=Salix viminalis TaxID=40686 RepID=A0A6N2K7D9_SALVM
MAKSSKLTKLKSAIKRLPSFTKIVRTNSSIAASSNDHQSDDHIDGRISKEAPCSLMDRSGGDEEDNRVVVVACEVVLFEHLLWMLESGGSQLGSMEELAEFYFTC